MIDLNKQAGTWKRGLLCLIFLAPFFFLTYGFANQYAANLSYVPSFAFEWEKSIPIWPWTIIPYWSIDLFYGLSLLLCWNKFELKQHVLRLFLAQIIAISCFLLFPLKFSFERPELHGFFGLWFDALMGFDKPFNQAPSLHIILLTILWDFYRRHVNNHWKYVVDLWSFLICISVLTTWQHHFIDIPTGMLAGALCLWLFPISVNSPFKKNKYQKITSKHLKLSIYYFIASAVLTIIALSYKSWGLWLFYPAISLFLVGCAYLCCRPHFFQKIENGKMTTASQLLFAPYLICTWLNSRLWTRNHPEDSQIVITDQFTLYLGRIPNKKHAKQYDFIFDCVAELPVDISCKYQQFLSLDLIPLQTKQLEQAVILFDHLLDQVQDHIDQKILIFCALGYSRSTAILCAWLIKNGYVKDEMEALKMIQLNRPWVKLSNEQLQNIQSYRIKIKEKTT